LAENTIDRWVKSGRLIAIHRGVYAVGHFPPSPHAKTMAALLACGPRAVLSHRSAAALWGLIRYDGPTEVTAPTKRRRPGIVVHRHELTERDITCHYALPVTTPARTLKDLPTTSQAAPCTPGSRRQRSQIRSPERKAAPSDAAAASRHQEHSPAGGRSRSSQAKR